MKDYRSSHTAERCATDYDAHYQRGRGYFFWEYFEKPYLMNLFARLGKEKQGRYLDFACGTGRILKIAVPFFEEAVGIDVSQNMLAAAGERVPAAHLVHLDVSEDTMELGTFKVITAFRFLLNAEEEMREKVLLWLRKAIAPDGILIVNNHLNQFSLAGKLARLQNRWNGSPAAVLTDVEVESLLRRCRFKVSERYNFGLLLPWPKWRYFPSMSLLKLERKLQQIEILQKYAKDQIYVCHPI